MCRRRISGRFSSAGSAKILCACRFKAAFKKHGPIIEQRFPGSWRTLRCHAPVNALAVRHATNAFKLAKCAHKPWANLVEPVLRAGRAGSTCRPRSVARPMRHFMGQRRVIMVEAAKQTARRHRDAVEARLVIGRITVMAQHGGNCSEEAVEFLAPPLGFNQCECGLRVEMGGQGCQAPAWAARSARCRTTCRPKMCGGAQ